MASAFVSTGQMRYLRACMVCSIVQTAQVHISISSFRDLAYEAVLTPSQRFRDQGCPNCDGFLHLQGSADAVETCTSAVFEGVITLADPTRSWVAKWQRLDKCHPGMYAIKVSGELPNDVRTMLEEDNIPYVP